MAPLPLSSRPARVLPPLPVPLHQPLTGTLLFRVEERGGLNLFRVERQGEGLFVYSGEVGSGGYCLEKRGGLFV